ncbi:MAG: prephenate dehydrogenase [Anaerolineales bacterium]|nr:prephenate dehydrogenase [Anaerolineales bacterium]
MTTNITIIGLGQIGMSIGLSLANHKDIVQRKGYDIDKEIGKTALKTDAVDEFSTNLVLAVRDADLIILALPINEIKDILEIIAPLIQDGTVVMDTAPAKKAVAGWVKELLPEGISYVGLAPILNPEYLAGESTVVDTAHGDLFQNGLLAIVTPPNTESRAIELATNLTELLGASPFFADLYELDSLMIATHVMPQILGAALVNSIVDQPGWREAKKLAGRAFAEVSGPIDHMDTAKALMAAAILNRNDTLRLLDGLMIALQAMRDDIDRENTDALIEKLENAQEGRKRWWRGRQTADWLSEETPHTDIPAASDIFGRLFRFGRGSREDRTQKE